MYQLNIIQHIHRLLMYVLRKQVNVAWLYVLLWPIKQLSIEFDLWTTTKLREVNYNGQVMVLERMLNLYFYGQDKWATAADPTASTGFYIDVVGSNLDHIYSWNDGEVVPVDEDVFSWSVDEVPAGTEVFVWNEAETAGLDYNFKVMIPAAFTYTENEVRALVDKYKLAGMAYIIETY